MTAIVLVLPLFLIRFGLLGLLDQDALKRAALFAPLTGKEKTAYWLYQISNILIFLILCFCTVSYDPYWLYPGLAVYGLGILLCILSVFAYAKPEKNGINLKGLYRFSRNPMYVAYFLYYLGCALLAASPLLIAVVLVFQISAHFIILSEERWCIGKFGDEYIQYMKKVRRYF